MDFIGIGIFQIATLIEIVQDEYGRGKQTGPISEIGHYIFENVCKQYNCSYVVPEDEKQFGSDVGNGTYDGVIGMIQRQTANISFMPFGYGLTPSVGHYLTPATAILGIIAQYPQLTTKTTDIMTNLDVLPWKVTFLLIILNLILAIILKLLQNKPTSNIRILFDLLACYVLQIHLQWSKSKSVVLTLLLSIFFTLGIYLNSISADLVVKDFSDVINNLEDLIRLPKKYPSFWKDDPFHELIKEGSTAVRRKVWQRAKDVGLSKCEFEVRPDQLPDLTPNVVFLGNEYAANGAQRVYCKRMIPGRTKENWKSFIGKESFAEIPYGFLVSHITSDKLRNQMTRLTENSMAFGLWPQFWKRAQRRLEATLSASTECLKEKMDDLYEDLATDTMMPIRWTNASGLFLLFALFLLALIAVFIIEFLA